MGLGGEVGEAEGRSLAPAASGVRIPELISVTSIVGLPFKSSGVGTGYKGRMPEKSTGDVSGGGSRGEPPLCEVVVCVKNDISSGLGVDASRIFSSGESKRLRQWLRMFANLYGPHLAFSLAGQQGTPDVERLTAES